MLARPWVSLVSSLLIMALAIPASAADGVREINQACVTNGCFAGDTPGFPVQVRGPGSYILTSNLDVSDPNGDAILFIGGAVSLDLNGFAVSGPYTCQGVGADLQCGPDGTGRGIRADVESVSIRHGAVRGFAGGGLRVGPECRVEGVHVEHNGDSGIRAGLGCILLGNTAARNFGVGIDTGEAMSTAAHNTAHQNSGDGIVARGGMLFANTVYQNGGSGIATTTGTTVTGNTARGNEGDGIQVTDGCLVRGNTSRGNTGHGLRLGSSSGYRENVVSQNTGGTVVGGTDLGANLLAP